MKLSDIRKQPPERDNDFIANAIATYEKNEQRYNKSIQWTLRITADELGIRNEELVDILEKYYEGSPNVKPQ